MKLTDLARGAFRILGVISLLLISARAATENIASPDGKIVCEVNTENGLSYTVTFDGHSVLTPSRLGLDLDNGRQLGKNVRLAAVSRSEHDSTWENHFGQRRRQRDHYREMVLELTENVSDARFSLIVRAYDDGLAFRYEVPRQEGLGTFTVVNEPTEFVFSSDSDCWIGDYSANAECLYPRKKLTQLSTDVAKPHVLPLVTQTPKYCVAVTESDLIDWAGMFLAAADPATDGTRRPGARVALAPRLDGKGRVAVANRRVSPWRVIMLASTPAGLVNSDLVVLLASPSRLEGTDQSWIKPGITSWDAWWTGLNPTQPKFSGEASRGDTRSHKEYIDFSAEMGWPYQLIDWFWYDSVNTPQSDMTKPASHVDIPGLVSYAREKNVSLFLWIDSRDLTRQGVDRIFALVAKWGFVGVKVDFMDSDSQETVQWYYDTIEKAAAHRLMIDFHGAYKPTGLARTWPNYITQEGVLGNEFNKLAGRDQCTPLHTITLPFTRGLLGPMDFTPGGFLNRTPKDFKYSSPTVVMGTRTRQLAMTVVYKSPLLCLCDSPTNYRGQPGIEFYRGLPTVWDDSVVLSAKIAEHILLARRSGNVWYLAAMNGDAPLTLKVPFSFLGAGKWTLHAFADAAESMVDPEKLSESTRSVSSDETIELTLAPAGGYAATITQVAH